MTIISPESLESARVYPDRFGRKGEVYYRFCCNFCGALLPEGATEDDEVCGPCKKEERFLCEEGQQRN